MKYFTTILIFSILLYSCKKENASTTNSPASEYFPNTIGDHWKYKLTDSITNQSVFVDVDIIGNKVLSWGQATKIWTFTYPNHTDTMYVYQIGDTIRVTDSSLTVKNAYITPLRLHNQWGTYPDYLYDTVTVSLNGTFHLNNQTFANSFLLNSHGHLPNDYWNKTEWFCPYYGMVTKNPKGFFAIANELSNAYWELIDYDLK